MTVFAIKASGNYSGGMAVVAANSKERAIEMAGTIRNIFNVRYDRPDEVDVLPVVYNGPEKLLTHYEMGE